MKTRIDFVSNSSSSSFIMSTDKKFSETCNDIINFQSNNEAITENNTIALKYFTKYYELLFLGYIPLYKETLDLDFDVTVSAFNIFTKDGCAKDYFLSYKDWYKQSSDSAKAEKYNEEESKLEFKKQFLESITNRTKYWDDWKTEPQMAQITNDTIKMTENIIECGIDLKYNKIIFDTIKKALSEGKKVYYITMGDEGEGMDEPERLFISRKTGINIFEPIGFKEITDCEIITTFEEDYNDEETTE